MNNNISLALQERTVEGKKVASLRAAGIVPSIVYGYGIKPISAQASVIELTKVVKAAGRHTPISLTINGKKHLAIIKSIDLDPIKRVLRHVAFHTIKQNEKLVTEVAIILTELGESVAERAGLIILQAIERVEVRALPADLPESIEVSVVNLATTEDKIMMSDLVLPANVEFADHEQDMELVVANVYEPSALQAANDAVGGDAEPEAAEEVAAEEGGDAPSATDTTKSAE